MSVLPFVLLAANMVAPGRDHTAVGGAIARVVDAELPLFTDDTDRHKTAALLVAIGYRESSLRADAIGDGGHSFCTFQVNDTSGGSAALLTDPDGCARRGFALLGLSLRACPKFPVAVYAAGPTGCTNLRAQRISNDRMALARSFVAGSKVSGRELAPASVPSTLVCLPARRRLEAA